MDASIPLVVMETFEEKKAEDMLLGVARQRFAKLARWSITDGLSTLTFGPQLVAKETKFNEPVELLRHIKASNEPSIYLLCDFHPYLQEQPEVVRLIKDIALNHLTVPNTLIFISHRLSLPKELTRYATGFSMPLPTDERILDIIREEAKAWSQKHGDTRIKTDNVTLQKTVATLQGLSSSDVRRLVRSAIWDDGALSAEDLPRVNRSKFQLMDLEGIVSFESEVDNFANVGGLHNMKQWLSQRREAFVDHASTLDRPKGILLLGVQGGGKSLAAKAVAGMWGLALLKLDMGALYNKYIGETERNLREALQLADAMSPCVLWLDEIEKAMSQGGGSDNGTSQRLLGTLLTWMAERPSRVFIVATSNDISKLPPELIRKGRLDEIFFVDLPNEEVRREIFEIHLKKRDLSPEQYDLAALSAASQGFNGAEIEQAVVGAVYQAQNGAHRLTTELLLQQCTATSPLSVVMAEQIASLRRWAQDRTVPA
ncbi:AAA family ATPase [Gilvimarinus agarilyticus]|uniref:AAA family ATPase n=1 Tax=Gilvimarinus sp. 2_MG-2023 TaxID=3062666 RepID=UPI001C0A4D2F|nr:AAA family ATPase [Gilvimarinus sp. 2_MG-2023]MBU2886466.1 AAA family ATPase [Gilvimarinus agarilyticus]MDO6571145.1 AAA family ATPase [Gilvimarinus sp. 2_MG-2023]